MKILFTGGGTGGHFYPIIALAEKVNNVVREKKLVEHKLYYMSDNPFDKEALFEQGMEFIQVQTGKMNLGGFFSVVAGVIQALFKIYKIYPDVIVGKGGYGSFPALFAARLLRIPVIIHESDTVPGKVNQWAGKFAERIALSYPEAAKYFPEEKTAFTGQPIRTKIEYPAKEGVYEYLKLDPTVPVLLILGGSQGARNINEAVLEILPELLEKYQIIHQAGKKNVEEIEIRIQAILRNNPYKDRYKVFGFLDPLATKMAAGAAKLVITRAGSALFEVASWGLPSIVIPLPSAHANHQTKNAFSYAHAGGCVVLEEANLTPHILLAEIDNLMKDEARRVTMGQNAEKFVKRDAGEKIAKEIISVALAHEK